MSTYLNTSNELIFVPDTNGVKFVRPESFNSGYKTVADLLKLPLSIYFLNTESMVQNCNDVMLEMVNATSKKSVEGKSVLTIAERTSALKVIANDQQIIRSKQIKIFEEKDLHLDGCVVNGLSIKSPWYNENNQLIGIFGCSILFDRHALSESLSLISQLGLLSPYQHVSKALLGGRIINNVYFSKRETEVLHHTIRGKSASKTGKILNISQRTVEYHLEMMKIKLAVSSKSALIDKVIETLLGSNHSQLS